MEQKGVNAAKLRPLEIAIAHLVADALELGTDRTAQRGVWGESLRQPGEQFQPPGPRRRDR